MKVTCKLAKMMRNEGVTDTRLAERISHGLDEPVKPQLVNDWCNGRGTPSHGYTLRIMRVTGWMYEELFEEE